MIDPTAESPRPGVFGGIRRGGVAESAPPPRSLAITVALEVVLAAVLTATVAAPASGAAPVSPRTAPLRESLLQAKARAGADCSWRLLESRLKQIEETVKDPPPEFRRGRAYVPDPGPEPESFALFRKDLEDQIVSCMTASQGRLDRALLELLEAADTAEAIAAKGGTGVDAAKIAQALLPIESFVVQVTEQRGALLAPAEAERQAAVLFDALERSARGVSCDEEIAVALGKVESGSTLTGFQALAGIQQGRPCLTKRGTAAVQSVLDGLADDLLRTPPTAGSAKVSRERVPQLARLLAPLVPEKAGALEKLASSAPAPIQAPVPPSPSPVAGKAASGPQSQVDRSGAPPVPEATAIPSSTPLLPGQTFKRDTWLAFDVWQSAWGNFAEVDKLLEYLRRNHIEEVFLNPGVGMSAKLYEENVKKLPPLFQKFRDGGVRKINFLYAELNYPIGEFARFLKLNEGLGVTLLADDSEFTDAAAAHFKKNRTAVQAEGIRYAAFVTVEKFGNSGVSKGTREWAVANLDEVLLMSYLSCDVASQAEILEPLLKVADATGRKEFVRIAILLGSKRMGKEVSCEKVLKADGVPGFLAALHKWARSHPSYGGIVLETNERYPSFDVAPASWLDSQRSSPSPR